MLPVTLQISRVLFAVFCWLAVMPSSAMADGAEVAAALRGMKGGWSLIADGKKLPIKMTYDQASKGGAITEMFGRELSVFSRDGSRLIMTHYCNSGSVPRLALADSSTATRWQFDLIDVANLPDPNALHVYQVIYHVISSKVIELDIVWHHAKTGDGESHEKYVMKKR